MSNWGIKLPSTFSELLSNVRPNSTVPYYQAHKNAEPECMANQSMSSMEILKSTDRRLKEAVGSIGKWKLLMEFEIKKSDENLKDALQTIEDQRRKITDVSNKNDLLHKQLERETKSKEDMELHIKTHSELYEQLNAQMIILNTNVAQHEKTVANLVDKYVEARNGYERLSDAFSMLTTRHEETCSNFKELLEKERVEFHSQKQEWHSSLSTTKNEHERVLEERITMLNQKEICIQELEAKCARFEEDNRYIREKANEFEILATKGESTTKLLEGKLTAYEMEIQTLTGVKHEIEEKLTSTQKNLSDVSAYLEKMVSEKEELQEKFRAAQHSYSTEQQNSATLKNEIKKLECTNDVLRTNLQASKVEIEAKFQLLAKAENEIRLSQETVESLNGEIFSLNSQLQSANELHCQTKQQLEKEQEAAARNMVQIEDLMTQLSVKDEEKTKLITKHDEELQDYKKQLAESKTELEQKAENLRILSCELANSQGCFEQSQKLMQSYVEERDKVKKSQEDKVAALEKHLATLRDAFAEKENICEGSQAAVKDKENLMKDIISEFDSFKQLKQREFRNLTRDLEETKRSLAEEKNASKETNANLRDLTNKIKEKTSENKELLSDLKRLQKTSDFQTKELNNYREKLEKLTEDHEALKVDFDILNTTLTKKEDDLKKALRKSASLYKSVEFYRSQLGEKEKELYKPSPPFSSPSTAAPSAAQSPSGNLLLTKRRHTVRPVSTQAAPRGPRPIVLPIGPYGLSKEGNTDSKDTVTDSNVAPKDDSDSSDGAYECNLPGENFGPDESTDRQCTPPSKKIKFVTLRKSVVRGRPRRPQPHV